MDTPQAFGSLSLVDKRVDHLQQVVQIFSGRLEGVVGNALPLRSICQKRDLFSMRLFSGRPGAAFPLLYYRVVQDTLGFLFNCLVRALRKLGEKR
jgi:hypothetical protein